MKRREFNKLVLCGVSFPFFRNALWLIDDGIIEYPFQSLEKAFQTINFDPERKGSSYFVVTADVHYGHEGSGGVSPIINEVNQMQSLPGFLCINGDMIVHGSTHFGRVPDETERQLAIDEFNALKRDSKMLDPGIRLILGLGNHDTHPKEIDPDMFWEVFPQHRPYQSFNLSGVHIVVLNGHSTGYIDPEQMKWLLNDMNSVSKDQTIIAFVHQPSMSHRVNERGIPAAISKAFGDHQGPIWLIGGHEHSNSERVFQLGNTELVEHHITCGGTNIWGGPEKPGYWIYCLEDGTVTGRIFRQMYQGYRIGSKPDFFRIEKVPMPFDHLKSIAWKILVGEGDREFLISGEAEYCLNYWAYVKKLIYRIPLQKAGTQSTRLTMLCNYNKSENHFQEGQYFMSLDLTHWQEIKPEEAKHDVFDFLIPVNFRPADNVYFKFTPLGEAYVGGFALS
jgi:hypothetical protein